MAEGSEAKTNIWAILGLIFSFFAPLLGLIFSIIALVQLKNHPEEKGKGLALAGLIISIVWFVILVVAGFITYFTLLNAGYGLLPKKSPFI